MKFEKYNSGFSTGLLKAGLLAVAASMMVACNDSDDKSNETSLAAGTNNLTIQSGKTANKLWFEYDQCRSGQVNL
ncbi:MAG: hypothetical protein CSA52_00100 [Gammaproteobacteria bacterium]|nr:MAG: hypothetical protein CSB48_06990 [Pseudomonadota bacterium]PIE38986.1 MAG: hypothetical protein CSA52_00100 [Gammaproteobacteria bacterium]